MEARLRWLGLGIVGLVATLFAAAPVDAQGSLTLRDRLLIASSPSMEAVTRMLAGSFADRYEGAQQPHLEVAGTQLGFERFCSGLGPETPDFLLVSRRMPRAIVEHCEANGVADIVEVRLGYGAIVLATRRGDIAPVLSSRHLYEALAAERTDGTAFSGNTATNWADVDPSLPRREIRVLVPDTGSGLRALMEDLILEAGCREVRPIRLLFEAAYRRAKCVTLRTDGRVTAVPSDGMVAALLSAPPGTIAVMSIDQLLRSGGNLLPLSLDGVLPGAASIMSLDYNQSQTKYLYAKRQHSQTRHGVGVVRGIRELLTEATSEQASGPGGYLTGAGLLPLPPADRTEQRRIADRMTLRSR
jgi:phosphate transport system substrate-binding protein